MGKRKEPSTEEDSILESPGVHKKHKKHKKHKHKKAKHQDDEDSVGDISVVDDEVEKPVIKLKIKIGGQTVGSTNVSKNVADPLVESAVGENVTIPAPGTSSPAASALPWEEAAEPQFNTKKAGDDTSDEEREWLDALEAGTLDDNGEVKKSKDPSLLTARQRSLLHGVNDDHLLQLPSGYKSSEMTEEQLQRRQQRAKKRREQAHEKREKDKKQTLDRLLKKQDTKSKSQKSRGSRRSHVPGFRYLCNKKAISISVPPGLNFPFTAQVAKPLPPPVSCGVSGCNQLKKYSCSKTGVPLCSLDCYKKNLNIRGLVST